MNMPTKIISRIIYDEDTGIPFLEDVHGNIHMAGNWSQALPLPPDRYYLQTISHLEFPDTENFHPIPNILTGESKTSFIIPTGKCWRPAFIMAGQDLLGGKKLDCLSIIGWYIDGQFTSIVPFINDIHYVLYEPLCFCANIKLELRIMPCSKKARVCILVGGELRDVG